MPPYEVVLNEVSGQVTKHISGKLTSLLKVINNLLQLFACSISYLGITLSPRKSLCIGKNSCNHLGYLSNILNLLCSRLPK